MHLELTVTLPDCQQSKSNVDRSSSCGFGLASLYSQSYLKIQQFKVLYQSKYETNVSEVWLTSPMEI